MYDIIKSGVNPLIALVWQPTHWIYSKWKTYHK